MSFSYTHLKLLVIWGLQWIPILSNSPLSAFCKAEGEGASKDTLFKSLRTQFSLWQLTTCMCRNVSKYHSWTFETLFWRIQYIIRNTGPQNVSTSIQMDINDPQSVRTSLLSFGRGRGACMTPFDVSNTCFLHSHSSFSTLVLVLKIYWHILSLQWHE